MELVAGRKRRVKKIPDSFIYEIMDGKPLYYKGYKKALRDNQNAESVMGASTLQAELIQYLLSLLFKVIDLTKYRIYTGELGIHLNTKNNLGGDIVIFDRKVLTSSKVWTHYADVPSLLHIEVDIQAELEDMTETGYIKKKTQKLLDFGTGKIVWIFTGTQQILIASANEDWKWIDWNKSVELWQGTSFCIGEYVKNESIELTGL